MTSGIVAGGSVPFRAADMWVLIELAIEILGEFVVQFVGEALAEVGFHVFGKRRKWRPLNRWLAGAGYVLLGALCGGVSLLLFPRSFIASESGRVVSLVVTPILAGLGMLGVGAMRTKRGEELIRLDRFAWAFLFVAATALVRFAFANTD